MLKDTAEVYPSARVVAGKPFTLRFAYTDAEGQVIDAPGTVTCDSVTQLDGTAVTTEAVVEVTRDAGDRPKVYTADVLAANAPTAPDLLTVVWTSVDGGSETRYVELVGRHYFTLADWSRFMDRSGASGIGESPGDDQVMTARMIAEQECERICGRSFVRRVRQVRVAAPRHGTSRLILPDADLVSVDAVSTVDGGTSFGASELANLQPTSGAMIERLDGTVWPDAPDWYQVRYTFGLLHPPAEIVHSVMRRAKYWLRAADTGTPDWATALTPDGAGVTFRVGETAATSGMTGDEQVNAVYRRHRRETRAVIA